MTKINMPYRRYAVALAACVLADDFDSFTSLSLGAVPASDASGLVIVDIDDAIKAKIAGHAMALYAFSHLASECEAHAYLIWKTRWSIEDEKDQGDDFEDDFDNEDGDYDDENE